MTITWNLYQSNKFNHPNCTKTFSYKCNIGVSTVKFIDAIGTRDHDFVLDAATGVQRTCPTGSYYGRQNTNASRLSRNVIGANRQPTTTAEIERRWRTLPSGSGRCGCLRIHSATVFTSTSILASDVPSSWRISFILSGVGNTSVFAAAMACVGKKSVSSRLATGVV